MAETIFRGPAYAAGSLVDGRIESMDGPGIEYQATCFPDTRYFPTRKDGMYPGRVPGFLNHPYAVLADNFPSAASTSSIAAAANVTNGTPMTLTTVAPGGSGASVPSLAQVSLIPFQKGSSAVVTALAIDLGFTTGTTVSGNTSVTVPDGTLFFPGEWIVIGGVGNAAGTTSLFTQVLAATATTITVATAFTPQKSLTNAPIGRTNLTMGALAPPQSYPPGIATVPTSVLPYLTGGLASILNPAEAIGRNIQILGVVGGTGGNFVIRGWDIYGVPMSETIAVGAGAVTGTGKKAFKYLATGTTNLTGGIVPQFTDAHNYSAGPGNVVGINLRSLLWEYTSIFYNGSFLSSSAGATPPWVAADTTNPATATTGDVRGTVNLNSSTAPLNVSPTGAQRLTIAMSLRLVDNISATPINPIPLFGVPQFTQ